MSDPTQPEGPPAAPAEGATKTFVLKMDGWLTDLMKRDLELDAPPPDALPSELVPPVVPPAEESGAPALELELELEPEPPHHAAPPPKR